MPKEIDYNWKMESDYCGRILKGRFSEALKKKAAEYISLFQKLNTTANPTIPYISAWAEGRNHIWYEFVGSRLLELMSCKASDAAQIFGECVTTRCSFGYQAEEDLVREFLKADEIKKIRQKLRLESKEKGVVEAVYQLTLPSGKSVWLKDQATVEYYDLDNICLSLGTLTFVTREMQAVELTIKTEEEQQQYKTLLENQLREQNKKIWQMQLDMVYRLARASKLRDAATGFHITKVGYYCQILGKAAGIRGDKLKLLYHASPLHDVGKIGIAESILQKPAKLTPHEFEQMKNHSVIGAKLLSGNDSGLLKVARLMALSHHERWDGSGYPFGLSRNQIPLAGRIASICDVFDALTSDRPYKQAWGIDASVAEIEKGRGRHFDPQLLDLFLKSLPAIKEVQHHFGQGLQP
ncbi:MAG: HD-GYP domain-containing protein [Desulfobacterales bacterium]|nr:HD-GYP domain-containing protein [Desulfobacterales bacterium]